MKHTVAKPTKCRFLPNKLHRQNIFFIRHIMSWHRKSNFSDFWPNIIQSQQFKSKKCFEGLICLEKIWLACNSVFHLVGSASVVSKSEVMLKMVLYSLEKIWKLISFICSRAAPILSWADLMPFLSKKFPIFFFQFLILIIQCTLVKKFKKNLLCSSALGQLQSCPEPIWCHFCQCGD